MRKDRLDSFGRLLGLFWYVNRQDNVLYLIIVLLPDIDQVHMPKTPQKREDEENPAAMGKDKPRDREGITDHAGVKYRDVTHHLSSYFYFLILRVYLRRQYTHRCRVF